MFGLSTVKLIGLGVGALMLLGLVLGLKHYKHLAAERGATIATICQATREASNLPKLKCGDVPAQITFMGQAVTALSNALKVQNAAVTALGAQSQREQAEAARARQNADKRAQAAESAADRLTASSHAGGHPGASCEPSKAVKEQWQ
jgi:hypothetical protein